VTHFASPRVPLDAPVAYNAQAFACSKTASRTENKYSLLFVSHQFFEDINISSLFLCYPIEDNLY